MAKPTGSLPRRMSRRVDGGIAEPARQLVRRAVADLAQRGRAEHAGVQRREVIEIVAVDAFDPLTVASHTACIPHTDSHASPRKTKPGQTLLRSARAVLSQLARSNNQRLLLRRLGRSFGRGGSGVSRSSSGSGVSRGGSSVGRSGSGISRGSSGVSEPEQRRQQPEQLPEQQLPAWRSRSSARGPRSKRQVQRSISCRGTPKISSDERDQTNVCSRFASRRGILASPGYI